MALELNSSLELVESKIIVKGKEINVDEIQDVEIYWDIDNLYTFGTVTFRDELNFIENAPILVNDEIELYFKDGLKKVYKQTFIIQKVVKAGTHKGVNHASLEIIDKNAIEFMKVYDSKGFVNTSVQDVIVDYYKKYNKEENRKMYNESTPTGWGNDGNASLIVPGDRSLFSSLNMFIKETDILLFNRRDDIMMTDYKKINTKEAKKDKFTINPDNQFYNYRIGDYYVKGGDSFANTITNSDTEIVTYDYKVGKKVVKQNLGFKEASDASKSLGKTDVITAPTNETKRIVYASNNSGSNMFIQKKYANRAIQVVMTVPGTFENNIGDVVEIVIPTSNNKLDIEKNISGKYLVIKITDKIIANKFVQQLTIARAKNK